ncbi:XTP/dITP diphosphohydrolase [Daejeonella rubra]|uniref:dITP/XTP pyrophosphatase n=1 Tax=Daejeonella rubra TaxID=990371 RepID=A0A1G9WBV7_9SPHI|nr:RdgB/HAM1 family non-canonical purine NTP pyrophosphatase [Daejeonella rubra]SDM81992.1 XTP/dITP diphosphohydrolase [Daejeonella rubra]
MELVFASNNQHKVDEVQAMIGSNIILKSLNDIGCLDEIPETGDTFAENAGQKSRYVYERYHIDCFADDSGLEIDALGGEPGVNSAHYSGSRDFEDNMSLVLERLSGKTDRKARFKTVISMIKGGKEHLFEGSIEGNITLQRSGSKGFGYDPIFVPEGYDISFAEMSPEEKNRISHRAKAMQKLISFLNSEYS